MGQTKLLKLPRGVTIRKHRQGETINITFTGDAANLLI